MTYRRYTYKEIEKFSTAQLESHLRDTNCASMYHRTIKGFLEKRKNELEEKKKEEEEKERNRIITNLHVTCAYFMQNVCGIAKASHCDIGLWNYASNDNTITFDEVLQCIVFEDMDYIVIEHKKE